MNYLFAESISKSYGDKDLFRDITLSINKGQRVALIAKNGIGKTSLLRMLTGTESPDSGSIQVRRDLRIGFLEQEPYLDPEKTIMETVFDADNDVVKAVKFYEECLENGADAKQMQRAMEQMETLR